MAEDLFQSWRSALRGKVILQQQQDASWFAEQIKCSIPEMPRYTRSVSCSPRLRKFSAVLGELSAEERTDEILELVKRTIQKRADSLIELH